MRKLIPILLLTLAACAQTRTKGGAFDKTVLENYIRHLELFVGDVKMKIDDPQASKVLPGYSEIAVHLSYDGGSKDELYFVSADGQTIIEGGDPSTPTIFNINKSPFQPALDKLHTEGQPSFGPANAPVTIIEFGDLECPSCKAEAPALRELLPQLYSDKVRVVFKDFPLETIHPWARAASDAARCVFHQNQAAFWKFYDWMYETQEQVNPDNLKSKVMDWGKMNGMDAAKLNTCIDTKAYDGEVAKNIEEGRALGVHGTPSLYIDGRKIGGVDFKVLQQIIDEELKYKAAGRP